MYNPVEKDWATKIKTVYNPNIISTDEYLERWLECTNNVLKNYENDILPYMLVGIYNHGESWISYCENGIISSMYPR